MKINGETVSFEQPVNLAEYLDTHQYSIKRIAVEINGQIVAKSRFASTFLQEEDVVEIVSFIGGG